MKVIDNFLPSYQFDKFQSFLMGENFDWYYNDETVFQGDGLYQFIHFFYKYEPSPTGLLWTPTPSFGCIKPYLSSFNMKRIYRIKANLNPRSVSHLKAGYHIDNIPCSTTAIFYINTCNGWTEFKKGDKVKSVANRVVIFDSTLEHSGVSCTNENRRVVINFNYDV